MNARGAGRRVLVVEDEFVIALEIEDVLLRAGYEMVGPASSAEEAERLAREEPLDVAVLDVGLHGAPAFRAADALADRGVPFLFLTGYSPETLPGRFRGRAVLGKPYEAARLPAALAAAIRDEGVRRLARDLGARGPARRPGGAALGRGRGGAPRRGDGGHRGDLVTGVALCPWAQGLSPGGRHHRPCPSASIVADGGCPGAAVASGQAGGPAAIHTAA